MQYFRPYNEDVVQYAKLSTTQIGTKKERLYSPHAHKLKNLNRLHIRKRYQKAVFIKARVEIKRILSALDVPHSFQEPIFLNFKNIYSKFPSGTKCRSVEKLVPVILYYSLRDHNVSLKIRKLLEVSKISKSEFNYFRMQVGQCIKKRDSIKQQLFISQKLMEIKEHFNLGMEFVFYAKKIITRLWELIKNTTDNVIAGVSASITVLCYYKNLVSINALCTLLGIRMSTIQFQVKHRIFENLKVEGFSTLMKSTNVLKTVMERLGVFEAEQEEIHENVMIKVELGHGVQIFNREHDVEPHLFGLLTANKEKVILRLKVYKPKREFDTSREDPSEKLFELELCKYSHGKGPPI